MVCAPPKTPPLQAEAQKHVVSSISLREEYRVRHKETNKEEKEELRERDLKRQRG